MIKSLFMRKNWKNGKKGDIDLRTAVPTKDGVLQKAVHKKLALLLSNPRHPSLNIKKIDHESTKIRRHESLNLVLFRAFNLSCFRDCVSEFSAIKNINYSTSYLIV